MYESVFRFALCGEITVAQRHGVFSPLSESIMRVFIPRLAFSLFLLTVSSLATADDISDMCRSLTYFYLHPSKKEFEGIQRQANASFDVLKRKENGASLLVAVGIARISQKNGWPLVEGPLTDVAKAIVDGKSKLAKYVDDDSVVDPSKLDIWWVSFMATGDEKYLDKILKFAGKPMPKDNPNEMLVIGAASWSFKSNCCQHKKILEYTKKKLAGGKIKGEQAEFLKRCDKEAEQEAEK